MANHGVPVRRLKRTDPVLARVIEAVGTCRFELRAEGTHFQALTRSIVYQQLSGKAAGTILGRFNALYDDGNPTPEAVLATSDEKLRAVGLSRQKIAYMRDLSARSPPVSFRWTPFTKWPITRSSTISSK